MKSPEGPKFRVIEGGIRPPTEVFSELPDLQEEATEYVELARDLSDYTKKLHRSFGRAIEVIPESVPALAEDIYVQLTLGELYIELHESLSEMRGVLLEPENNPFEMDMSAYALAQKALMVAIDLKISPAT